MTYRVLGSAGTAAIAYGATGSLQLGAAVGVVDTVVKIGLYYFHERIWYRVRWGVLPDTHATMPDTPHGETLRPLAAKPPG